MRNMGRIPDGRHGISEAGPGRTRACHRPLGPGCKIEKNPIEISDRGNVQIKENSQVRITDFPLVFDTIQPPRAEVSFGPDGAAAAPAVAGPPRRPRTLHLCSKSSLPGPRSGQGGAMSKASNASKASKARKEGRTDGERGRGMRTTGGGGEEAATALFKTSTQPQEDWEKRVLEP